MRRKYLLVVLILVALAGCNQSGPNPVKEGKALILGEVSSPFYTALADRLTTTGYDGSQAFSDYALVIFDGDYYTPEEVQASETVRQAIRSGGWVLGLDMTTQHKRAGLGELVQAATGIDSSAYAVRVGQDANGRHEAYVLEFPAGDQAENGGVISTVAGALPADATAQPENTPVGSCPGKLVERLGESASQERQVSDNPIPPDLHYATYYLTTCESWTITDAYHKKGYQYPQYEVNYTFKVFLDNRNNPQGNFQFVLTEANMSANPAIDGKFINLAPLPLATEMAWFQSAAVVDIAPWAASSITQDWILQGTSPSTVNGQTTVTSSIGFDIGFDSDGPTGSFNYSTSTSRKISDWKVSNDSAGARAYWRYGTAYPVDFSKPIKCLEQRIFGFDCYIAKKPNDLSLNTLDISTQAVWKTPRVIDDWASMITYSEHTLADVYCFFYEDVCVSGHKLETKKREADFKINLGAVLPVPIESITFNPNPVPAGTAVTGTLTLEKPAPVNAPITLKSNLENATVLPTTTVEKGQQMTDFQVLTNANGIAPGGSKVATITAFYAQDFQAQLTVKNDSGTSPGE